MLKAKFDKRDQSLVEVNTCPAQLAYMSRHGVWLAKRARGCCSYQ